MMAIIEICNSGSFYCSNRKLSIRLQLRLPGYTFPQYLFHHQLTYLSMITEKEKCLSCFSSIKLPSKEFLCLKISCLNGWTMVLKDWIQDLDAFRKILNISCTDSLRKTRCFLSIFITSYSGALY